MKIKFWRMLSIFFCVATFVASLSIVGCLNLSLTGDNKGTGEHKHSYVNYAFNNDATCTQNGTETAKCEGCDQTSTREALNSKKGHSFTSYISDNNATCTQNGTATAKCEACEQTDVRELTNSATGHSFTNYIPDGGGRATAVCDNGCGKRDTITDGVLPAGTAQEIPDAEFSIHFLELGNKYTGDSTLIKCGNTEILIDAGSRKDSAATIKKYVDKYCADGVLEYVITTHAHQDHIAGFVGESVSGKKTGILYQYNVGTLIKFDKTNANSAIYKDYLTAVDYAKGKGTSVYTATQCWYQTDGAQRKYYLNESKTLSMNILYNYYYDHSTGEENNYSVCMLLTYESGTKTYNYLFTGDLESGGESKLVDNNPDLPQVELFKGGHHGSYTASTDKLLRVIKPQNVAVCCCVGTPEFNAAKGHEFPAQEFIDRVSKYTQNIYCTTLILDYSAGEFTSMNGNIVFYYKDRMKLYCSNGNTALKDTQWFKDNRK